MVARCIIYFCTLSLSVCWTPSQCKLWIHLEGVKGGVRIVWPFDLAGYCGTEHRLALRGLAAAVLGPKTFAYWLLPWSVLLLGLNIFRYCSAASGTVVCVPSDCTDSYFLCCCSFHLYLVLLSLCFVSCCIVFLPHYSQVHYSCYVIHTQSHIDLHAFCF